MTFTLFDILILTILSISSLFGLYRGMINITINLLGFIASIIVAIFLYSYIRIVFSGYVDNDLVTSIASGVTAYIISLIVFTFITSKILLLFDGASKGVFDRFLGLVVGIIRGGLFVLIVFAIIAIFTAGTYSGADKPEDLIHNLSADDYPGWLKDSTTTPYLEKMLKSSTSLIPDEIWNSITMPQKSQSEDDDIIDAIKKRKNGDVQSSIEVPLDQGLENDIEAMFPEGE